jgi:hypothetical protein
MRAHIICTALIKGIWRTVVQSSPYLKAAPACEKVTIPEGSSSAAPVISPGPKEFRIPGVY